MVRWRKAQSHVDQANEFQGPIRQLSRISRLPEQRNENGSGSGTRAPFIAMCNEQQKGDK